MQDAEKVYVKLACVQNVSDECNLITVICYRVEELIVPVLINQNLNESCIFLNENHAHLG